MDNTLINPKDYEDKYIYYLNLCFTNWGTDKDYNWVFNRTVGDKTSDIIIIKDEDNEVIAGSGVSYRKLKTKNNTTIDIGIMTGSWTLPKARGKGCFSKMIAISKNICYQKGVPFLTAFVMEDNPSFRRLKDAGSFLIPTHHFFSKEVSYSNTDNVSIVKEEIQVKSEIYNKFKEAQNDYLNFNYTSEEFFQQYINRIKNTEILKIGNEYAIIEETKSIIKVLYTTYDNLSSFENNIKSIANWGLQNKSKKLLIFSTKTDIAEVLNNIEFDDLSGYFTVLSAFKDSVINMDMFNLININLGDKV